MGQTILVTGATGNVGAEVAHLLQHTGHLWVAVRNASTQHAQGSGLLPTMFGRFHRPHYISLMPCVMSASYSWSVPGHLTGKAFHPPFDRCGQGSRSRCNRVLSIQAAERNPFVPHRKIETYIQASASRTPFCVPASLCRI